MKSSMLAAALLAASAVASAQDGDIVIGVKLVTQARQAGVATQFYNLAAQANRKVAADLGEHTNGVIFTTLVPSPWRDALPIVKEYQQVYSAASGKADYSYLDLGLEVFINAKLLVEGLRKAGRSGSNYVGPTIVSRQGRFVERSTHLLSNK